MRDVFVGLVLLGQLATSALSAVALPHLYNYYSTLRAICQELFDLPCHLGQVGGRIVSRPSFGGDLWRGEFCSLFLFLFS